MDYNLIFKKSRRAKSLRLRIQSESEVSVTIPFFLSKKRAMAILENHKDHIEKIITDQNKNAIFIAKGDDDYKNNKAKALDLIKIKIIFYNNIYQFEYNKIQIKNNKSSWGSCSSKKNLNFNYRIIFLPEEIANYIVAHELCHLKEMNHSPRFWALVENTVSNHKALRRQLKKYKF